MPTERVSAVVRANRVLAFVLAIMLVGCGLVPSLMTLPKSGSNAVRVVAAIAAVIASSYGLWLCLSGSGRDRDGTAQTMWIDHVALWGLLGIGLTFELLVTDVAVISGLVNPGFDAIVASMYIAGVRLRFRSNLLPLAAAITGHLVALQDRPIAGVEGAVNILLICAASRLVTREIRHAGEVQDRAFARAEFVEHEEGVARVHDGLGLLRVAMRQHPSKDLLLAARATSDRTDQWILGPTEDVVTMAAGIHATSAQFPDLHPEVNVETCTGSDPVVVAAVDRAVHTLLTNVRMHSKASRVAIVGWAAADTWTVRITDDGRGFDASSTSLAGGIERIARAALNSVGAHLTVTSTVGGGTTAVLSGTSGHQVGDVRRPTGFWSRRFTSWHDKPTQGRQRALWISDLGQLCLLCLPSFFLIIGFSYLRRHVQVPDVAASVAIGGVTCLLLLWLAGPRPPRLPGLMLSIGAFACGASLVWMEGADAVVGEKAGILLILSAAVMLCGARPECWPMGIAMAFVTLVMLGRIDIASGVVFAVFMMVGIVAASLIVSSLLRFADETELDIKRVADLERRLAGQVLRRQISAIQGLPTADEESRTRGSDSEPLSRLHPAAVAREAEAYLHPLGFWLPELVELLQAHTAAESTEGVDRHLRPLSSQVDFGSREAELLVDVVRVLATAARKRSGKPVTVRGAYLPPSWLITVLLPDTPAKDVQPSIDLRSAELAGSGMSMTATPVHLSILVTIRPT